MNNNKATASGECNPTDGPTAIVNPNTNLIIPTWINAEYFTEIAAKDIADFEKIITFVATAAIPPGENFTSLMVRVHMDVQLKDCTSSQLHKTYVLKTMLENENVAAIVRELSLFPKEMQMYATFLPQFESMYEAAGLKVELSGKCLLSEKSEKRMLIIFEDLRARGFQNIERLQGCDMQHMRLVLRKLAELHAASAVYGQLHGAYPQDFYYGFLKPSDLNHALKNFEVKAKMFKQCMRSWGVPDADHYIDNFPTTEQFKRCALSTLNCQQNSFNVLTHGDFWSSNIMFSYTPENSVNECLFVDYQVCKWGSPAEDLLFFITISAAPDIRIKHFEHFVQIYFEHLIKCLKTLKYQSSLPTLRSIQQALYSPNTSFYAFFAMFNHLPLVVYPADKDSSISSTMREDEVGEKFRERLYTNSKFVEAMRDLWPFFYRKGLLNFKDYDEA